MSNPVTKCDVSLTKSIFEESIKIVNVIINKVFTSNKSIDDNQKAVWLESLTLKKEELTSLFKQYGDKELNREESSQFNSQVKEIINSCLEINNKYVQKLEKKHEQNMGILKSCIIGLIGLGITGIIGFSGIQISKNVKK